MFAALNYKFMICSSLSAYLTTSFAPISFTSLKAISDVYWAILALFSVSQFDKENP